MQPSYTNTLAPTDTSASCTPFFYLHFWNTSKKLWVVYDAVTYPFVLWDAANGGLKINTNDFGLDMTDYLARITTMVTGTSFSDEFTITIKDKCRDVTLVSGT